jgi:hypothetical protein
MKKCRKPAMLNGDQAMNAKHHVRPGSPVVFAILLAGLAMESGCGPSRPQRVMPPALNPAAVAKAALQVADADADGSLSRQEAERVPGLAMGFTQLDADGDGGISAAEIEDWLNAVKASRVALTSLIVIVSQNGKPLRDVTVKLVPEDFMGGGMKVAEGTTDTGGGTMLAIPGSPYPGVNCGLYRVEITGSGANGRPIPARYNAETTLGAAVGGVLPDGGTLKFELEGP